MNRDNRDELSLERLQAGDRAEFARLVDAYSDLIYRLGLKMMGNEQDAEDILQETFLKALRSIHNFRGGSSLSTWLYRIAANEALMLIRKRRPEQEQGSIDEVGDDEQETPLQIVDWGALPEDRLLSNETTTVLNRLVESLSPALRAVFILRDVMEQSVQETAQALDISESAVKTRLSRARLQLRQQLSAYFHQGLLTEDQAYGKE